MKKKNLTEEKCIQIEGIELESSREPTRIDRIRLKTNNGDITWKPIRRETSVLEVDGFKIRRRQYKPIYVKNLPKIFFDIRDRLNNNGNASVRADYTEWNSPDGNTFNIFNDKQIEEMKLMDPN